MPKSEQELEKLAFEAKNGNTKAFDAILLEFDKELKQLANKYYINGSESQDVMQEARIGLWRSIGDWEPDGGMSFKNFCISICVKRHILTAISTGNRKKNDPLNTAISFNLQLTSGDDDNEQYFGDFLPDPCLMPIEQCISQDEYKMNSSRISNKLTKLEKMIFVEYMKGQTYSEIAVILLIKTKAVDNALMRIRKKAASLWINTEKDF